MPTTAINTFSNIGLQPAFSPEDAVTKPVKLVASVTYAKGEVLGEKIGANAKHRVTITGVPTAGTFTLTFNGQTTAAIAFGASMPTIRAALEALSSVLAGNVVVTGSWNNVGAIIDVEWRGTLGQAAQTTITCSIASLTGGTPAQATSSLVTGAPGTPGTFGKYSSTDTTGLGKARCLLKYACSTDASGNITGPGGQWGETTLDVPAYFGGYFKTSDLTGLTEGNIEDLGSLVSGDIAPTTGGIIRVH